MTTDHKLSPLECQIMGAIAAFGNGNAVPLKELWARFGQPDAIHLSLNQFRDALNNLRRIGLIAAAPDDCVVLRPAGAAYMFEGKTVESLIESVERAEKNAQQDSGERATGDAKANGDSVSELAANRHRAPREGTSTPSQSAHSLANGLDFSAPCPPSRAMTSPVTFTSNDGLRLLSLILARSVQLHNQCDAHLMAGELKCAARLRMDLAMHMADIRTFVQMLGVQSEYTEALLQLCSITGAVAASA